MGVMPPEHSGEVVAHRADVVEVDHRPYDPQIPLVCMDEQPVPLMQAVRPPLPAAEGQPERSDYEDERNGTANIFLFTEPLSGGHTVSVRAHKTAMDWATEVQQLLDTRDPEAERSRLVCDTRNTHGMGSLSEAFPPEQARRLASRLESHDTPQHGSGLNIAEIERSALTLPCLARRIPDVETLIDETKQWEQRRNAAQKGVDWQCSTHDASIKLKRLYPQMQS
jgi:DDE superfamily endonuclease